MTKDEAKKLSDILKAYSEGKIIEVSNNGSQWAELNMSYPDVVFKYNQHRIKPEPKLVPFTFKDRDMFKDKWVKSKIKDSNVIKRFINISENYICIDNKGLFSLFTYETLLNDFEFEDGSPCGKCVNE